MEMHKHKHAHVKTCWGGMGWDPRDVSAAGKMSKLKHVSLLIAQVTRVWLVIWTRLAVGLQVRTGKGAWGQVRAGRFRWTITIDVGAHRVWGKPGQTEACSNLQGQVPARGGQCGQGWAWKHVTNREKQRCHHFFVSNVRSVTDLPT